MLTTFSIDIKSETIRSFVQRNKSATNRTFVKRTESATILVQTDHCGFPPLVAPPLTGEVWNQRFRCSEELGRFLELGEQNAGRKAQC